MSQEERLAKILLPVRSEPLYLSPWASLGIEIDCCPDCDRTHGQHHLRDCPRKGGFVRPNGKHCIFCKAPAGSQHRKYQGEPCPNWF